MILGNPLYDWGRGFSWYTPPQKMPSPCLHSCAIFAPMCHAFKMQPNLHNSADRGISKFFYLRLHLVVCFYPQPPTWPWSRGHMYRRIAWAGWVLLLLERHFEVSLDTPILMVADPSIRAWRISSFEDAPFISRSGVDHPVWHEHAIKIVEIIVRVVEIIVRS